jgi:hypothetical protein
MPDSKMYESSAVAMFESGSIDHVVAPTIVPFTWYGDGVAPMLLVTCALRGFSDFVWKVAWAYLLGPSG